MNPRPAALPKASPRRLLASAAALLAAAWLAACNRPAAPAPEAGAPSPTPAAQSAPAGQTPEAGLPPVAANEVWVYVVRHAEAWKNVPHPASLKPAELDNLTQKGNSDAKFLGASLFSAKPTAIFTSPAVRCRQTAMGITAGAGLNAIAFIEPALAQLIEGTTTDGKPFTMEMRAEAAAKGIDATPVDGEAYFDGLKRVQEFGGRLLEKYAGQRVVVVTHGDIAALLIGEAAHTPLLERMARHEPGLATAVPIIISSKGWRLP